MIDVHLHGSLEKTFGKKYSFKVESVGEIIQALRANFPSFANAIRHGFYKVVIGKSVRNGLALGEDEIAGFKLGTRPVHILPVVKGRKRGGLGKVIAGIALIGLSIAPGFAPIMGASLFNGGTTLGSMAGTLGVSMVLTGVASMLAPEIEAEDTTESFTMSGPSSNLREGAIIPIGYGEVITGGYMISGGVEIDGVVGESGSDNSSSANAIRNVVMSIFQNGRKEQVAGGSQAKPFNSGTGTIFASPIGK